MAAMEKALAALPRRRALVVTGSPDQVPWRCVGGAIYTLQRLGHKDVTFVAESLGK